MGKASIIICIWQWRNQVAKQVTRTAQDYMVHVRQEIKIQACWLWIQGFLYDRYLNMQCTKISAMKIVKIQVPEFPTTETLILKLWGRTQQSAFFDTHTNWFWCQWVMNHCLGSSVRTPGRCRRCPRLWLHSHHYKNLKFFFFLIKKIFFILAALGLCCCTWAFSSCSKWGLLFVAAHGFLIVVASLVAEHGL